MLYLENLSDCFHDESKPIFTNKDTILHAPPPQKRFS